LSIYTADHVCLEELSQTRKFTSGLPHPVKRVLGHQSYLEIRKSLDNIGPLQMLPRDLNEFKASGILRNCKTLVGIMKCGVI
jgi:hypothetical protein